MTTQTRNAFPGGKAAIVRNSAFAAVLLSLAMGVSAPAQAGTTRAGIHIGPDSFGVFVTAREHRAWRADRGHRKFRRDGRKARRGHRRARRGIAYERLYPREGHWYLARSRTAFRRGHGCYVVFKRGYHDGYRAVIRGRMCYGPGGTYVVRGSRRAVNYY